MLQHYKWFLDKPDERVIKQLPVYQKRMDDFAEKVIAENPTISKTEAQIQWLLIRLIEVDTIQWGQHELRDWKEKHLKGWNSLNEDEDF